MTQLSPNFWLAEFEQSQTALNHRLDNSVPADLIPSLRALTVRVLQPVRDHFGAVVITSGYRSPAVNRIIGGSPTSQHCKAEAADFRAVHWRTDEVARWIERHLEFDQLILEYWSPLAPKGGWVHCSYREGRNRKQVLTIDRRGTRAGLPGAD